IPIGISRTSVDAWTNPQLFYLDSQAGAPPDDFSILGQNWGFPTYNWEEMSRDGFKWWKGRFVKMAQYCDAYRIDHVLGFFRIWQIPMDAIHGLLGYFNQALPLTAEEMAHDYDFTFDADLFTHPYITEDILHDLFGEYYNEVCATYLDKTADDLYTIKPPYSTQRKIADLFGTMESTDRTKRIANGMMALIDEVLFIKDPHSPDRYHPRIAASQTRIYHTLKDSQRQSFDRLYNDFFYHRHNNFWLNKAMWKLPPLINATGMLTCAEDLGMIPHCVPEVMERLQILSLEIQRMPKAPGHQFGDPAHYPYYSVCTTSTHDMSGIRGWWEENRESTRAFYNNILGHEGEAPFFAEPWIC
ncbi:MAG: 4-alpha-glucanotransferase, partial [Muribaculaceae bacterium]|nr:4-alpha-glucanotransferase [Muribaculaceae bacterium]